MSCFIFIALFCGNIIVNMKRVVKGKKGEGS